VEIEVCTTIPITIPQTLSFIPPLRAIEGYSEAKEMPTDKQEYINIKRNFAYLAFLYI
jgi:hypothetical protein